MLRRQRQGLGDRESINANLLFILIDCIVFNTAYIESDYTSGARYQWPKTPGWHKVDITAPGLRSVLQVLVEVAGVDVPPIGSLTVGEVVFFCRG